MTALLDTTVRHLHRIALGKQRDGRVPGLYAGVCRGGELVWGDGIGVADVGAERAPTADDQFLVASNTKTFTAVMVMQLRDEGRLGARRPARRPRARGVPPAHDPAVPGPRVGHGPRAARRRVGDARATRRQDAAPRLRRRRADRCRPHDHWHYSNVVYAMLGQLVARARRPVLGGVAAHPAARPARDAAYVGRLRRRAARDRLLRRAVRRRAPARAGDGPQGDGAVRRPGQHRRTTWRRWSAFVADPVVAALRRHDRGDVPAADPARPRRSGPARWVSASS